MIFAIGKLISREHIVTWDLSQQRVALTSFWRGHAQIWRSTFSCRRPSCKASRRPLLAKQRSMCESQLIARTTAPPSGLIELRTRLRVELLQEARSPLDVRWQAAGVCVGSLVLVGLVRLVCRLTSRAFRWGCGRRCGGDRNVARRQNDLCEPNWEAK